RSLWDDAPAVPSAGCMLPRGSTRRSTRRSIRRAWTACEADVHPVRLRRIDVDDVRRAVEVPAGALERRLGDLPVAGERVVEIPDQKKDVRDRTSERGGHERMEPQLVEREQVDRAHREHGPGVE